VTGQQNLSREFKVANWLGYNKWISCRRNLAHLPAVGEEGFKMWKVFANIILNKK
jgi:hypothetical protein